MAGCGPDRAPPTSWPCRPCCGRGPGFTGIAQTDELVCGPFTAATHPNLARLGSHSRGPCSKTSGSDVALHATTVLLKHARGLLIVTVPWGAALAGHGLRPVFGGLARSPTEGTKNTALSRASAMSPAENPSSNAQTRKFSQLPAA